MQNRLWVDQIIIIATPKGVTREGDQGTEASPISQVKVEKKDKKF